ncbi:MAG: hypothetical protein R6X10_15820 [Desulfobacterales bacterium]
MEPEKMKQLEAKLKSLFEESNKEMEVIEQPRPQSVNNKVVIRRRNGVSQKLVSDAAG